MALRSVKYREEDKVPFRFSIQHANWLAHALQGNGVAPGLRDHSEWATLEMFAKARIDVDNYNSFSPSLGALAQILESMTPSETGRRLALRRLGHYFTQTPWVSLLVPSGNHAVSDQLLTDPAFLRDTLSSIPVKGPVLQLEQVPGQEIILEYVFPAFKVALAQITRWPGLLIWDRSGHASVFFELSPDPQVISNRLQWIFSRLAVMGFLPDLLALNQQFSDDVLGQSGASSQVRILHLSDLHLGSSVARQHLPRVQKLIELAVIELGERAPIIPVITGDLIDSPDEKSLGDFRAFQMFLGHLGVESSIAVLGNHDVRKAGWRDHSLKQAVNIPRTPVIWMDEHAVAIACFNSVNAGCLARGSIGTNELAHVGNALDEHPEKADFTIVAALHHHPIPVNVPPWYQRPFYERLMSHNFEKTEDLEDAKLS